MGFASGFAEAFGQSYGQAKAIRARKEESEYEWRMKGLFDEKERRLDLEKKAKAAQATAKSISERTGAPLREVYNRLKDGGDASSVQEWAEGGDWTPVKYTNGSLDVFSIPDPQSIESEMSGSGLAAAESPVNDGGTSVREVEGQGYTYRPKPKVMKPDEQKADLIRERSLLEDDDPRAAEIDEQLGRWGRAGNLADGPSTQTGATKADLIRAVATAPIGTPEREEAQSALDMYTQAEADQGLLSGGEQLGTIIDENGDRVVVPLKPVRTNSGVGFIPRGGNAPAEGAAVMGEDEKKAYNEFQKVGNSPEVVKQNEKVVALASGLRSSARLQAMVQKDQDILLPVTGTAVDFIDSARKEFLAATNLFGVEINRNSAESTAKSIGELEKRLEGIDVSTITDRAQLRDLFNAEMGILAYRMGIAEGQSGNAFSEKDYNRIAAGLRGSTTAAAFKDNINGYMSGQLRAVEDSGAAMSEFNNSLKQFEATYDYLPTKAMPSPSDFIAARSFGRNGEVLDPELIEGYRAARMAKPFNGINNTPTQNTQTESTPNVKNNDGWISTPNGAKFKRVQ